MPKRVRTWMTAAVVSLPLAVVGLTVPAGGQEAARAGFSLQYDVYAAGFRSAKVDLDLRMAGSGYETELRADHAPHMADYLGQVEASSEAALLKELLLLELEYKDRRDIPWAAADYLESYAKHKPTVQEVLRQHRRSAAGPAQGNAGRHQLQYKICKLKLVT